MSKRESSVHRAHQAMGPGHEFDTIRMLMSRGGDLAADIGDDAAVLLPQANRSRVISTDACVEGAHFRRHWLAPREVGVRAAAAALSDLAAMGARAEAVLIALVVPDDWRLLLGDVADGMGEVVRASGARIVGGNLSRGDAFAITTTVVGSADHVVSRRGALPGDVMVVTGKLGGPGRAIRAWDAGEKPSAWARARFAAPIPRLAEGSALANADAHAMIDISDGLISDARHLAAASGVRLSIDATRVPVGEDVDPRDVLSSGEEYELLAALPPKAAERLLVDWRGVFDVPLTVIGRVEAFEPGGAIDIAGISAAIPGAVSPSRVEFDTGHDHFSR